MLNKVGEIKRSSREENIAFFDEFAKNYNSILEQNNANKIIRQRVAEIFCNSVKPGLVLDFGGGTGLDLSWLTENEFKIFFLEPSSAMRQHAIDYNNNILHSGDIVFLDDAKTDFSLWDKELPFSQKVDAILSNFIVINNIQNIELLFRNLALISKPHAHLIALILDGRFRKTIQHHPRSTISSFIFQKTATFQDESRGQRRTVYIHSTHQIKRASRDYFNFYKQEFFPEAGFVLIHLIRK
jgi:SAM-dependent methyltransferase